MKNGDKHIRREMAKRCIGRNYHYRPRATRRFLAVLGPDALPEHYNVRRCHRADKTKDVRAIRRTERQAARVEIEREFLLPVRDTNYWGSEVYPNQWAYEAAKEQRERDYQEYSRRLDEEYAQVCTDYPDSWEFWADDSSLRYFEKREMWDEYNREVEWARAQAAKPENVARGERMRRAEQMARNPQPAGEMLCKFWPTAA